MSRAPVRASQSIAFPCLVSIQPQGITGCTSVARSGACSRLRTSSMTIAGRNRLGLTTLIGYHMLSHRERLVSQMPSVYAIPCSSCPGSLLPSPSRRSSAQTRDPPRPRARRAPIGPHRRASPPMSESITWLRRSRLDHLRPTSAARSPALWPNRSHPPILRPAFHIEGLDLKCR